MIDKATNAFIAWCCRDTPAARLQRTVVQGVLGVVVGLIVGISNAPEWVSVAAVPLTMAILSPIQAAIGDAAMCDEAKAEGSD